MRHEAGTMTGNLACLAGDAQRPKRYEELKHARDGMSVWLLVCGCRFSVSPSGLTRRGEGLDLTDHSELIADR